MTDCPKIEISRYQKEDGFYEVISVNVVLNVRGQNQYSNLEEALIESVSKSEVDTLVGYWEEVAKDNGMNFEVEDELFEDKNPFEAKELLS